ncbi:hypothetical protein BV898_01083 [Hypsibius exemplaris]|uniref:Peptidase S1 domain-containing protein n=1 Tax=Hypsibius exemplaris TaxID=2072580 RepID=A0A1W0XD48_HYPEX|nr:hypothetical protein BV898_01083 [Hypsibius exemplaris]
MAGLSGEIVFLLLTFIFMECLADLSTSSNTTLLLNVTSSTRKPTLEDRQLTADSAPRCGIPGSGGNDPFGLQAQFIKTTTPATTTAAPATAPAAGPRVGPFLDNLTLTAFPGASGQASPNNDIFFTGLGPILENESALTPLNASTSNANFVGNGRRHVVPRILRKREIPAGVSKDGNNVHIALPNQLCWQVQISTQIRISTSRFSVSSCAGAIVGASTVLTAAHCVLNPIAASQSSTQQLIPADDISVTVGKLSSDSCSTSPEKTTKCNGDSCASASVEALNCMESFPVVKVVKHSEYNAVLGDNDLALLLLAKPINFLTKSCACALCLQNNAPAIGENCLVSGFGDELFIGNRSSSVLKWTTLKTRQASATSSACGFNVDDTTGKMTNLDQFICAGGTKGESSCQGDSGGPLVCFNQAASSHYLAGISAFGPPCGVNIGAMYSNMAKFLPWIVTNSRGDAAVSQ